jgi:signal peptidase I
LASCVVVVVVAVVVVAVVTIRVRWFRIRTAGMSSTCLHWSFVVVRSFVRSVVVVFVVIAPGEILKLLLTALIRLHLCCSHTTLAFFQHVPPAQPAGQPQRAGHS